MTNKKIRNSLMSSLIGALRRHQAFFQISKWAYIKFFQFGSSFRWKKVSQLDRIMLNLGSGRKLGENGWTTVDLVGADINFDLRKGIPLECGSVDEIYSSHMLEHIPYNELIDFIGECKRVLKKGGHFSVCVPSAGFFINAYAEHRVFPAVDQLYAPAIIDTGSYLDQVNYMAYMGGEHCYMFDEENLINTLKRGGFKNVKLRSFDETIDLPERDSVSIYALATK